MYLVIQQHNSCPAVILRDHDGPSLRDTDKATSEGVASALVERRVMDVGYYDLFLLRAMPTKEGWHCTDAIDHELMIA